MTIDMHLTLPPGFVEYTRRVSHTHCCLGNSLSSALLSMWCRGRWGLPLCSSVLIRATLRLTSTVSHFAENSYIACSKRVAVDIAGFWETLTYGLLGMYKSDWTTTGGFDVQKYTTKWGGEDWGAVDRLARPFVELTL